MFSGATTENKTNERGRLSKDVSREKENTIKSGMMKGDVLYFLKRQERMNERRHFKIRTSGYKNVSLI